MKYCKLVEFDSVSYQKGLDYQRQAADVIRGGEQDGVLLLLEHNPVLTIGRAGGWENILAPEETIKDMGIEIFETNRGGNITYHGPGQLVGYPILNLARWKKDVHWYVRSVEQVVINTLQVYGIKGERKTQYPGVWVEDRKIAAVGINIKSWITTHGFSFQITKQAFKYFNLINPCGITEFGVIALEELIPGITIDEVRKTLKKTFGNIFDCQFL